MRPDAMDGAGCLMENMPTTDDARRWLRRFVEQNGLLLLLIVAAAAMRLLPHPANIAPIGALALFSGAYLERRLFYLVPLAALFLGDLHLGLYHAGTMGAVYLGFLASTFIGRGLLRGRDSGGRIVAAVGAGALAFWLISNLGVWLFFRPLTPAGLAQCYSDALPFLGRSLLGDALYAAVLFGAYKLARRLVNARQSDNWSLLNSPSSPSGR